MNNSSQSKVLIMLASLLGLTAVFIFSMIFAQHFVEGQVRQNLDRTIAKSDGKVATTYQSVKVSFLRRKIDIRGLEFTVVSEKPNPITVKLDQIEISDIDDLELCPRRASRRRRTSES
jgi:hypothetical protein